MANSHIEVAYDPGWWDEAAMRVHTAILSELEHRIRSIPNQNRGVTLGGAIDIIIDYLKEDK